MPNSSPAALVPHDPRLRAATRKLNIVAWVAIAIALALVKYGTDLLFGHSHAGLGEVLHEHLHELMWEPPDRFLFGLTVITALAPMLVCWRRSVGLTVEVERVRRRRAMALVGLFGALLMALLTQFDMALLRRAVDLGAERLGWNFGCIWPNGEYQAALVGFGRLAVVLRIESAVIDALARDARSLGLRRQLWRIFVACTLAACAAAPFAWLGIEDYVASEHPRGWELPGLAYVVAFGVFELCARLGLLGRRGRHARRTPRPAARASDTAAAPRRRRAQVKPRVAADPAALALGHRALMRARRWFLLGTSLGALALAWLVCTAGGELLGAFEHRTEIPPAILMMLICGLSLAFVYFQPALESQTSAPLRPRLASAGLERVLQLLGQALAQLERGHDQQFEESYYDFTARFEALEADELETLADRGIDPVRLRSLPATWVDAERFFDAELRRGIHRELMQIQATIIGRPSADPYRADLGACGLVDSIGLGWLRGGRARDLELGQTHRTRNVAVLASLVAWVVAAVGVGMLAAAVDFDFCIPGVDSCRLDFNPQAAEFAGLALLVLAPFVVWAIGLAHRCVATRCFTLALPELANEAPTSSPQSQAFTSKQTSLALTHATWFRRSLAPCWLMLAAIPIASVWSCFGHQPWLGHATRDPSVFVLLGMLVSFALACARPIRHGHRRLCARVWLAWLDRRGKGGDELTAATLATLVRHRIELVTSSPPARESIEALIVSVTAAPLPIHDRDAMLERLESALERAVALSPDDLLELEQDLWVCELWIAESGA